MTQHKPDWLLILGASAGGLEALEAFFKHCPSDLGCAYVVIQHLSPDYKSIMDELLARYTAMPVVMVKESMQPEANTIYLIPAGTTIMNRLAKGYSDAEIAALAAYFSTLDPKGVASVGAKK